MAPPSIEKQASSASGEEYMPGSAPLDCNMTVQLSQAQFEELYLQPFKMSRQQEKNALTFGSPTLIGLLSFCCTFTPTCCSLMSFGAATPSTMTAFVGVFYLFGGAMGWLTAIGEFILGNSFSMVTFAGFGSFWMIFGTLNEPNMGLAAALGGPTSPAFPDSVGMFICIFGFFTFIGIFAAVRTNVVFLLVFFTVTLSAELIGCGYLYLTRDPTVGANLLKAGGAVGFVTCCVSAGGAYEPCTELCADISAVIANSSAGTSLPFSGSFVAVDFPYRLPVGDLSTKVRGGSERAAASAA